MDLKRPYQIFPLQGLDAVKFGMSPAEVAAQFGSPAHTSKNFTGETIETWDAATVSYSNDNQTVVEIGFSRQLSGVFLNSIHLFSQDSRQVIDALLLLAGETYEGKGFFVFPILGISLFGFLHADESDKTATVFQEGRWDRLIKKMNRITKLA